MVAREAAQADGARAHPMRHLAEPLQRMFGKAEIAQILAIRAVPMRKARSIHADFAERFGSEQFAGEQRLRKADHVFSGGEQPGVAAEIAPAVAEKQGFRIMRRAAGHVGAQNPIVALDAVLVIVADAAGAQRLRHDGERLLHTGGRENPRSDGLEQAHPRLRLDDILDRHGVHVGIDADSGRGADAHGKQAAQSRLTGRSGVDAAGRLQADAEAEHIAHRHVPKAGKARVDLPDPFIQREAAALHERQRDDGGKQLGQRREIVNRVGLERANGGEKAAFRARQLLRAAILRPFAVNRRAVGDGNAGQHTAFVAEKTHVGLETFIHGGTSEKRRASAGKAGRMFEFIAKNKRGNGHGDAAAQRRAGGRNRGGAERNP